MGLHFTVTYSRSEEQWLVLVLVQQLLLTDAWPPSSAFILSYLTSSIAGCTAQWMGMEELMVCTGVQQGDASPVSSSRGIHTSFSFTLQDLNCPNVTWRIMVVEPREVCPSDLEGAEWHIFAKWFYFPQLRHVWSLAGQFWALGVCVLDPELPQESCLWCWRSPCCLVRCVTGSGAVSGTSIPAPDDCCCCFSCDCEFGLLCEGREIYYGGFIPH